MISTQLPQLADYIASASALLASFALGVSWSAYRAVGWVERMRTWANSTTIEGNENG